nr:MAG TPA: hypothetical protein [Caudoviricetes sp.]
MVRQDSRCQNLFSSVLFYTLIVEYFLLFVNKKDNFLIKFSKERRKRCYMTKLKK